MAALASKKGNYMNRFKKEERKRRHEQRKGLTPEQVKALDLPKIENALIQKLARQIHTERFSEEYDSMYDDHADVADRKKGKNPMSEEYIEKVTNKRKVLGVTQLTGNGMSESNDTWELCIQEARRNIGELRTRINEIMYYKWDPLRISNSNRASAEYDSYVPEALRLASESTSYHPISDIPLMWPRKSCP